MTYHVDKSVDLDAAGESWPCIIQLAVQLDYARVPYEHFGCRGSVQECEASVTIEDIATDGKAPRKALWRAAEAWLEEHYDELVREAESNAN